MAQIRIPNRGPIAPVIAADGSCWEFVGTSGLPPDTLAAIADPNNSSPGAGAERAGFTPFDDIPSCFAFIAIPDEEDGIPQTPDPTIFSPSPSPGSLDRYVLCSSPSPGIPDQIGPTNPVFSPSPSPGLLDEYVLCSSPSPGIPDQIGPTNPVFSPSPSPGVVAISSPFVVSSPTGDAAGGLCCETACPGGNPNIQVTVSGINWDDLDLDIGVHCVCPDNYSLEASSETWSFYNATANPSDSGIRFSATTTHSSGIIYVNYSSDQHSYTTGVTGHLQDRLFAAYTANGLTATFQRGCGW